MYTTPSKFRCSNSDVNQTISWKMLSADQCEEIFVTAAEVLERSGAVVESEEARKIFAENGCWVDGDIVRIPSAKSEWALRTAPSRVTLCNKEGKRALLLETQNVHLGPCTGAEKVVDRKSGEPRDIKLADVEDAARLMEALNNIEFAALPGLPTDVPEHKNILAGLKALLTYTTKPVVLPVCCGKVAEKAIDMAAAAVGGKDNLRHNPYLILSIECSEARYHDEYAMSAVIAAAKAGVPFVYQNKLVAGDTAPATPAGTLVVALANTIVAVLLAQFVAEGAPVIAGGKFTFYDEAHEAVPFGAPEGGLISAGFANLMNYCKLPSAVDSGITDAASTDMQAGVELAIGLLPTGLSGVNLLGCAQIESGKQYSDGYLAMADEVMGVIYRIMKSFEVDEDHLACGVYDTVEPGGAYLGEDHTNVFFKSEQFWPNLITRKRIEDWMAEGSKTLGQRSLEYVDTILAKPGVSTLSDAAAAKIDEIFAAAE